MNIRLGAALAALLCFAFVGSASAASGPMHQLHVPQGKTRSAMAAAAAAAPDLFRCKTKAEFDGESCLWGAPMPTGFSSSSYDYAIGGWTYFDYVVKNYTFRFTAPDGVVQNLAWVLQSPSSSFCPGDYMHTDVDLSKTCYSDGVAQGAFTKHKVGTWKIELLADSVLVWSATTVMKAAELRIMSGNGLSAPVGMPLRTNPTVSLFHFDGSLVDVADSSSGYNTDIITFTTTSPSKATGFSVSSPTYVWHATYAAVQVSMGSKVGQYTAKGSIAGAVMASSFTFTAVKGEGGPDDTKDEEGNGDDCGVGDPVTIGLGNSFQQETDYPRSGVSLLEFTRSYNALGSKSQLMRNYWTTTFDRFVILPPAAGQPAKVRRADGRTLVFPDVGGVYQSRPYVEASLTKLPTGWKLVDVDQTVELYDTLGRLLSITDAAGRSLTTTIDSRTGKMTKVTSNTGEFLTFAYDANSQLASVTDNGGRTWTYTYDGYANLLSAGRPDGRFINYFYRDPTNPYLITSLTNANGASQNQPTEDYAHVYWIYDSEGRVTSNFFNSPYDPYKRVDITYNADGSRTVRDSLGRETIYTVTKVNGRPFITGVKGPGFASCGLADSAIEYDADMNVTARTAFGRRTEYGAYDSKGQYGFMIEAAGTTDARRTDYTYDPRFVGKPATISTPSILPGHQKVIRITYNAAGMVTRSEVSGFRPNGSAESRATDYEFAGPLGQLSKVDGPRTDVSDVSLYTYDATSKRLIQVTDADGIVRRSQITYTPSGQIAGELRPNGLKLAYTYLPGTNLIASLIETQGTSKRTTTWTYSDKQKVQDIKFSDGINPDLEIDFGYNHSGDLIWVGNPGSDYGTHTSSPYESKIVFTLDSEGNHLREAKGAFGVADWQEPVVTQWTDRTFDAYNRVDRLINATGTQDFESHPDGTLTSVTDGKNHTTSYEYDVFKRMTRSIQPGQLVTTYGYDGQDNLVRVTDPKGTDTRYTYDDLGNRLSTQSPDAGNSSTSFDDAGNPISTTDAKGQTTARTYSPGNRLLTVDRPGVAQDETYSYDTCAGGVGNLCRVSSGNGEFVAYEYDGLGRTSKVTTTAGALAYAYDARDNVTGITYPSGRRVNFAHNSASQVTQVAVVDGARSYPLVSNIRNLPLGPADAWTYGNGLAESRTYNAQYLPTSLGVDGKFKITIPQYDSNGNVLQRVVNGISENYSYDDLNRLATASGAFGVREYGYDAGGNRTRVSSNGVETLSQYANGSNRATSDSGYTYTLDPNGNLTAKQAGNIGTQYGYTADNRLQTVNALGDVTGATAVYVYNALGQRTLKSVNGAERRFVYGTDGQLLSESLADGTIVEEYVYLNGQPVALLGTPYRKAAPPSIDAIVDDPAGSYVGSWTSKNLTSAYGGKYRQLTVADPYTDHFQWDWRPSISGTYDIWVWWVRKPTDGTRTFYYIDDASASLAVEHSAQAVGTWAYLGRQHLTAGRQALWLDEWGAQPQYGNLTAGTLAADAARFKLIEQDTGLEGRYQYVVTDQLGTPQAVTDYRQAMVWNASYDPFGAASVNSDPDGDGLPNALNLRFPGQYFDSETSLHYNYNRYYATDSGRYLHADPMGLAGGSNAFAYASENPLGNADPLGLWTLSITGYDVFGGSIILAGDGFSFTAVSFKLGVGVGGGVAFNPWGEAPDPEMRCTGNGIGVYADAAGVAGPVAAGAGVNYGGTRSEDGEWHEYGGAEPELAGTKSEGGVPIHLGGFGIEGEASAGIQLTHYFQQADCGCEHRK